MQAIIGSLMIYIGRKADDLIENVRLPVIPFNCMTDINVRYWKAETNIWQVTGFFFALVFFAATQGKYCCYSFTNLSHYNISLDIAVDGTFSAFLLPIRYSCRFATFSGWALTLLSQANLSYASTAQTVGLTSGTFLSYTVFLALNSVDFA
jgi:hypothetical protein